MSRMVPVKAVNGQVPALLAADPTTLAPATLANKLHLIAAPFTPGQLTDFTTLTPAAFAGSTPLLAGTGPQQSFRDPITNNLVVEVKEPAGGWTYICTTAPGTPETIYGAVLTDNASAVTLGSMLLPNPVTITSVGDAVVIDNVQLQLAPGFMG